MTLTNNTILITGGTSGLGLEMARQFISRGNKVIVCSRTKEKLLETKRILPEVILYQCDISSEDERVELKKWICENYPDLNVLINNAAIVHKADFISDVESYEKAVAEINTNLVAPIHLIKLLYPVLLKNPEPKIINITTGLVYVPRKVYPIYNATKSALHSFTQVLRSQSEDKRLKIIEVLFPAVDTPWHQGSPPKVAIAAEEAVNKMIGELSKGALEIKVAGVKILYYLSRIAPGFAFRKINSLK